MKKAETKRTAAIILVLAMIFGMSPTSASSAADPARLVTIPVFCNLSSKTSITAVQYDGEIYINADTVKALTGANAATTETGNSIYYFDFGMNSTFKDGNETIEPFTRRILVDANAQTMTEGKKSGVGSKKNNTGALSCYIYDGEAYFLAYPLLTALGAKCSVENGKMTVVSPAITYWNSIRSAAEGLSSAYIDWETNGYDSGWATATAICDGFIDLFTPGGMADVFNPLSWGSMANPHPAVIENSLFADLEQYDATQEATEGIGSAVGGVLDGLNQTGEVLGSALTVANALTTDHLNQVMDNLFKSGILQKGASQSEITNALADAGKEHLQTLQSELKNLGYGVTAFNVLSSFVSTVSMRLGVQADRVDAVADVFSKETLKRCKNVEEQDFFSNARDVAKNLDKSDILSTVATSLFESIGKKGGATLTTLGITKGVELLGKETVKKVAGVLGKAVAVVSIAGIIAKLFGGSHMDAATSDIYLRNAIWQMRYEKQIVSDLFSLACDEAFMDQRTLEQLRNAYIVLYQTALYAHEQTKKTAEDAPERFNNAEREIEKQEKFCESIAAVLNDLYIAQAVAVPKFSSLRKESAAFNKSAVGLGDAGRNNTTSEETTQSVGVTPKENSTSFVPIPDGAIPTVRSSFVVGKNGSTSQSASLGLVDVSGNEVGDFYAPWDNVWNITGNSIRQPDQIWPVTKGGKWGAIDLKGTVVIPFEYSDASEFDKGIIAVEKDNKWGFFNNNGVKLTECIYTSYGDGTHSNLTGMLGHGSRSGWSSSENGFIPVCNGKWGFIDNTGKQVIPCQYDLVATFREGLCAVMTGDYVGFINEQNEMVIDQIYHYTTNIIWLTYGFENGLAYVELNDSQGVIDRNGNYVLPLGTGNYNLTNLTGKPYAFFEGCIIFNGNLYSCDGTLLRENTDAAAIGEQTFFSTRGDRPAVIDFGGNVIFEGEKSNIYNEYYCDGYYFGLGLKEAPLIIVDEQGNAFSIPEGRHKLTFCDEGWMINARDDTFVYDTNGNLLRAVANKDAKYWRNHMIYLYNPDDKNNTRWAVTNITTGETHFFGSVETSLSTISANCPALIVSNDSKTFYGLYVVDKLAIPTEYTKITSAQNETNVFILERGIETKKIYVSQDGTVIEL
jgi:hypothetical protein